MNNVNLMGRLTKDPELRRTQSGTAVLSFTLAVDRGIKDESGYRPVDFIDCVAWRQKAEFINSYFSKGQMMAIQGALRVRTWEDNDAIRRKAVEVLVENTYFCGSRREVTPEPENTPKQDEYADDHGNIAGYDDDDLPF